MPRFKTRTFPFSIDTATAAGVLLANASSLNPTDLVCLESWFKPVPGINLVLFDNSQAGATFSYFLSCDGNGTLSWFSTIGGISRNILNISTKARTHGWNFISGYYDGSQINVCLNGASISTLAASGALGTNSGQTRVGQYFNSGVPVSGRMTQARGYRRVYTLLDHQSRYYGNIDNATMRTGLFLDEQMGEGSGSVVADSSGSGNTGTFSRAVWNVDAPFKERSSVSGRLETSGRAAVSGRVFIT